MVNEKAISVIFFKGKNSLKYLLLKYNIHNQNHWDFVKGKVEEKETEEETAKRESKEEIGIENIVTIKGFRENSKYSYKKNTGEIANKEIVYFISEISEKESKKIKISKEHGDYKWLNFEESLNLLIFENQKKILRKANCFIAH